MQALQKLGKECVKLSAELLAVLQDLKIKGADRLKWQSFKKTLMHVKMEKVIQDLETRLNKYRQQIVVQLP